MSDSDNSSDGNNRARNNDSDSDEDGADYVGSLETFVKTAGSIYLGRTFAEDNPFEVTGLGRGEATNESKKQFVDFVACGKLPGDRNRSFALATEDLLLPTTQEERELQMPNDELAPEIRLTRDLDSAYGSSSRLCIKQSFDLLKMPDEKDLLRRNIGCSVTILHNGRVSDALLYCSVDLRSTAW